MSRKAIKPFLSNEVQSSDGITPSEFLITYFQKNKITYSPLL